MSTERGTDEEVDRSLGLRFWSTTAIGWAIIAFGVRGLVHHSIDTRPANLTKFVVLSALLHDVILAPIVLGVGVVVSRLPPGKPKAYVQTALLASGTVALFAYPAVRGYGHSLPNTPGYLTHNYTEELGVVVAAIWVVVGAAYLMSHRLTGHRLIGHRVDKGATHGQDSSRQSV